MGGAMDIIAGAKKVIVVSTFQKKDGSCILTESLTLPCTALHGADLIITDLCVVRIMEKGFCVEEIADGCTFEQLQSMTDAVLLFFLQTFLENVKITGKENSCEGGKYCFCI